MSKASELIIKLEEITKMPFINPVWLDEVFREIGRPNYKDKIKGGYSFKWHRYEDIARKIGFKRDFPKDMKKHLKEINKELNKIFHKMFPKAPEDAKLLFVAGPTGISIRLRVLVKE